MSSRKKENESTKNTIDHDRENSPFPIRYTDSVKAEEQKSRNIFPNTDPKMEHSSDYVIAEGYRCANLWLNKQSFKFWTPALCLKTLQGGMIAETRNLLEQIKGRVERLTWAEIERGLSHKELNNQLYIQQAIANTGKGELAFSTYPEPHSSIEKMEKATSHRAMKAKAYRVEFEKRANEIKIRREKLQARQLTHKTQDA